MERFFGRLLVAEERTNDSRGMHRLDRVDYLLLDQVACCQVQLFCAAQRPVMLLWFQIDQNPPEL